MRPMQLVTTAMLAAIFAVPAVGQQSSPEERLAEQFAMDASLALEFEPLSLDAVEAAVVLLETVTDLVPEDLMAWRHLQDLAILLERDDLRSRAVAHIVRLDPADQVTQLQFIGGQVDQLHTAAERIDFYERLLADGRLPDVVAARLALDLSLIHQRRGDDEEFARWLAESVALDPGFRTAAAIAAGYFRTRVADVVEEAELLVNLMLADPAGDAIQLELGQLMLEHGAYAASARLHQMALGSRAIDRRYADTDLQSDFALAQWGMGEHRAAIATLDRQHRARGEVIRAEARAEDPALSSLELARIAPPLEPTSAAIRAAIFERIDDPDAAIALDRAMRACDQAIEAIEAEEEPSTARIARLNLDKAGLLLWLGSDVQAAQDLVEMAVALEPMTDKAAQRFAGWIALRRGEREPAFAALRPLSDEDPAARLGLAVAELEFNGDAGRRPAARLLLSVAQERPDSAIGVWAAERLFGIIGQRAAISGNAKRLQQLIDDVPNIFDRYSENFTLALGVRIEPTKSTFGPYEPIIVNIEIVNNSLYPLSIDPDGPIRPQVMLNVTARIAQHSDLGSLAPMVIDIDHRLTLQPKERLVVPVDLRRYRLGQVLNMAPLPGALIKVRATTNFVGTDIGSFRPGVLGSKAETKTFRIDGTRINRAWIEQTMADIVNIETPRDIELMASLSHIAAAGLAASLAPEERQLLGDCISALEDVYVRLDSISRAWLLTVMRQGPTIEPILDHARASGDTHVIMAYLIYGVRDLRDPMLKIAQRSDDERLVRMATASVGMMGQRLNPFELDRLPGEMQSAGDSDSP